MKYLQQGHSFGINLTLGRPVSGTSYWHYAYNSPEQGFDFSFINTGNMRQLGLQFTGSYFLNLPLRRKTLTEGSLKRIRFQHWLGLGIGMGYATRSWDLETNHQAAVLGSAGNIALTLQYSARLKQFENGELRGGVRISHLSNGAFQLPNLGTNNAAIFLAFRNGQSKKQTITAPATAETEKWRFTWSVCAGLKEIPPPTEKKHPVFTTGILLEKRFTYKSSIGAGVDLLNNTSLQELMLQRGDAIMAASSSIQLGAVISYTLHFNDFELKMQQGFYLADRWKTDGVLYHRFGLRYRVSPRVFAQLTLKTHYAKADYGEFGLGFSLNR
jgi:hypothetical protein